MAERYGSGAPRVLALHGWRRTRNDWDQVLDGLGALAVDLPGFGLTPQPEQAWGSPDYASQLVPLLQEQGPAVVVGHSFGGRVAVALASTHPELCTGIVLTGAPLLRRPGSGKSPLAFRAARRLHRLGLVSAKRMDRAREKYGSADYRAAQGVMRETFVKLVNENYDAQLARIAAAGLPVRMVWGRTDNEAPLAAAEHVRAAIKNSELTVLDNSGHLLDAPLRAALRASIDDLLASSSGPATAGESQA